MTEPKRETVGSRIEHGGIFDRHFIFGNAHKYNEVTNDLLHDYVYTFSRVCAPSKSGESRNPLYAQIRAMNGKVHDVNLADCYYHEEATVEELRRAEAESLRIKIANAVPKLHHACS